MKKSKMKKPLRWKNPDELRVDRVDFFRERTFDFLLTPSRLIHSFIIHPNEIIRTKVTKVSNTHTHTHNIIISFVTA